MKNASSSSLVPRQHYPNVLPLKGEIDLHVSPVLTQSLNAMTEKKPERMVIDLSRATYIDSAGLAALILAMQTVQAYGGRLFLTGLHETMRPVFETPRLDQEFVIFPDIIRPPSPTHPVSLTSRNHLR